MCRQLVVLTGAGCSTESSVPDYRGPQGAYSTGFKPITHQQAGPAAPALDIYPIMSIPDEALLLWAVEPMACMLQSYLTRK